MPHPTLTTPGGLGVTLADVSRWGVDFDRLQLALDRGNGGTKAKKVTFCGVVCANDESLLLCSCGNRS